MPWSLESWTAGGDVWLLVVIWWMLIEQSKNFFYCLNIAQFSAPLAQISAWGKASSKIEEGIFHYSPLIENKSLVWGEKKRILVLNYQITNWTDRKTHPKLRMQWHNISSHSKGSLFLHQSRLNHSYELAPVGQEHRGHANPCVLWYIKVAPAVWCCHWWRRGVTALTVC